MLNQSWWIVLSAVVFCGCSQAPEVTTEVKQVASNLGILHRAYLKFCTENNAPPSNETELKPYIAQQHQADAFTSPRDLKPYKIYWGTPLDYTNIKSPIIIAHEQDGQGGSRFAFHMFAVVEMSHAEFAAAGLPRAE